MFLYTAYPSPTVTPTVSQNVTGAGAAAVAADSSNTGTILGGLAVGLVGVLGAVMVFMNAPTKTINTFLVNIINRVPLPDSIKNAIGNDPIGKLKSMRIPKDMIDKLPVPDSVKSAIESALPGSADVPPSSAQAPVLADDKVADVVVPVTAAAAVAVTTAAVVSKNTTAPAPAPPRIAFAEIPVARAPVPEPRPAPIVPPKPASTVAPKLAAPHAAPAKPTSPPQSRATSPPPGIVKKQEQKQDHKAKIEVDAKDLAAIQA